MRQRSTHIHELPDWPLFRWDRDVLTGPLAELRHRQGRLLGRMQGLSPQLQKEAELETLAVEVVKSSEIAGVHLNPDQTRSAIAQRLGMAVAAAGSNRRRQGYGGPPKRSAKAEDPASVEDPASKAAPRVDAMVEMVLDATQNFVAPLSANRLFGWHGAQTWRIDANGLAQTAPPPARLEKEMARFLKWANGSNRTDPVLRAAIAHLGFVTIRPFDDANGRIARAIADWHLARSENSAQRFYSMSSQISLERDDYYKVLERTQLGTLDITEWLQWFLGCLGRAFDSTETTLAPVLRKARFWERAAGLAINDRQRLILNRLLEGYTGILTTQKWAARTGVSHDTALRDIQGLIDQGLLKKDTGGGRSTSYSLAD